jgi:NAD(P)-dependent dehydrogenase (short-subunit alcohol dehydrogenase family)
MSRFGPETTTDEVLDGLDLTGTTVLITGASAGLGVETSRALAAHGARLVLGVRDRAKGTSSLSGAGIAADAYDLREVDLADLRSVRAFCDGVLADYDALDVLIANAGVMACPEGTTADGFETQLGTNHLGHFVLINRLVPLLLAGAPSRIVNLSSGGHKFSDVSLDDPGFDRTPYDRWIAYGRSKTANVLFAVELDRRLRERGVRATAVHPGGILTELGRHLDDAAIEEMARIRGDRPLSFKTVPAGAATSVWAAAVADPDAIGGRYCEDCGVSDITDDPSAGTGVYAYALDSDRARQLWSVSERLVGESFDP